MPKLIELSELGPNTPMFVNFDNVLFVEVEGQGTALHFSKEHRILVNEKAEAIASIVEGGK